MREEMLHETTLVLGASSNPNRFSYKANRLLKEHGHKTCLVHPKETEIEGQVVYKDLSAVIDTKAVIHTITVYVNPSISSHLLHEFLSVAPKRVVFNPGTENSDLEKSLREAGVEVVKDCTLIMLNSGTY